MKATNSPLAAGQSGVMLLEALIAILIFSLGILSLVALQATAVQLTSDAKYRTDATLLANRLIGQMWTSGYSPADLKTKFETNGTLYNAWLADVSGKEGLPGVVAATAGVVSTLPTVEVTPVPPPPALPLAADVEIRISWRTPEMPLNAAGHQLVVVSQISRNP